MDLKTGKLVETAYRVSHKDKDFDDGTKPKEKEEEKDF
jgi:hypothetical protein